MEENSRSEAKKLRRQDSDLSSIVSKTKESTEQVKAHNNSSESSNNKSSESTATVSGRRSNASSSSWADRRNSFKGFFKNGPQIFYDEMLG